MQERVTYNKVFQINSTTLPAHTGHAFSPESKFSAGGATYDLYIDDQDRDEFDIQGIPEEGDYILQDELHQIGEEDFPLVEPISGYWQMMCFITPVPKAEQITTVFGALCEYLENEYANAFTISQITVVREQFYRDRNNLPEGMFHGMIVNMLLSPEYD